jgi:hypothetical protein
VIATTCVTTVLARQILSASRWLTGVQQRAHDGLSIERELVRMGLQRRAHLPHSRWNGENAGGEAVRRDGVLQDASKIRCTGMPYTFRLVIFDAPDSASTLI